MSSPKSAPTITCNCCELDFDSPKKSKHKSHFLNNIAFCYQCRITFRGIWQRIVLECQGKLSEVYKQNMCVGSPTSSQSGLDQEKTTNLVQKYSSIIITHIKKSSNRNSPCPKNYKLWSTQQFCKYQFAWKTKCEWCVFKKMTPLVYKIPVFRYYVGDYKKDYDFWKQFFSLNSLVCQRVVGCFEGGESTEEALEVEVEPVEGDDLNKVQEVKQEATMQSSDASADKIDTKNEIKIFFEPHLTGKINQLHNILKQIHQDQLNSCFYLEGMFETPINIIPSQESPTSLHEITGAGADTASTASTPSELLIPDAQELISVERCQRKWKLKKVHIHELKSMQESLQNCDYVMRNFCHDLFDFNFKQGKKIVAPQPLFKNKPSHQIFMFFKIMMNQ